MHLQRSNVHDRDMGLAMEASYSTTIEELEATLQQSQSEVQSLRNQLNRLEFSKPDKGKGKARTSNYTPENDVLRHNPLPAPPVVIPIERYATLAGDIRSSSAEAEQVAAAIEASIYDRRGRDGYSSDVGISSAGAGASRSRDTNRHLAFAQSSEPRGYSQHHAEPPANYVPIQTYPPPIPPISTRPRVSSKPPEALPIVLDSAVSQAQQYASRSSPSRRHRIVAGALENDRIYVPLSANQQWPQAGSQSTYVNGYASASVPPPASAPVEDPSRKHRRRHKSKSRTHRREEQSQRTREGAGREDMAGVTGLGLVDESFEEKREVDPHAAFVNGYMEGLNSGFSARVGATPGPPVSAPLPRSVRFNAGAQSIVPPTTVIATTSSEIQQPSRHRTPQTTAQTIPPEGLANRLRDLMEDPLHSSSQPQAQQSADRRASAVPSETNTWGTVTTANSSRRQSNASDVMANLRGFPEHAQYRTSLASSQEIPVGDPRAFLPIIPVNANTNSNRPPPTDGTNGFSASVVSSSARPELQSNNYANVNYTSETPVASNTRSTLHGQVNQSAGTVSTTGARPVNQRYNSVPVNTSDNNRNHGQSRDHRPPPLPTLDAIPNPNPLPALPYFGHPPPALGSAPPRPAFNEYNSAPAVPMVPSGSSGPSSASRASNPRTCNNSNTRTPVANLNALGLELNEDDDYDSGYAPEPIPSFAAPTPRASHNLFLRSFSFDNNGNEVDANLYR
ncbi:hypothetical protein J3R30DRAFT_653134 [Lentinula aciculospora]|uniref:Uncharacterized protein n=1 Tax=Lentinula aciculospora TaxID=153920 RepID=A0A9W9A4F4_9AGAR|nr:hypothetical protein J3R30DRAFT_653134 [Lentinula aciculospora]